VSANPVGVVGKDAAKLLSDAVVKVTAQAIEPALEPFKKELADAVSKLTQQVEELGEIATDQDNLLRQVQEHFRAIASQLEVGAGVTSAASDAIAEQQATAPTLSRVDEPDEPAVWRELEAAISEALWRYAETVARFRRDAAGLSSDLRRVHLARLAAARRARQVLRAAEDSAAADAIEHHATYAMLADAAGIARQTASKRYRPR